MGPKFRLEKKSYFNKRRFTIFFNKTETNKFQENEVTKRNFIVGC